MKPINFKVFSFSRYFLHLSTLILIAITLGCTYEPEVIILEISATPITKYVLATSIPLVPTLTPRTTATKTSSPTLTPTSDHIVNWDDARKYIGEVKTVCGPVIGAIYAERSAGKPTFLNIGKNYPNPERFTIVIWGQSRSLFIDKPEDVFTEQIICVTGQISTYKGVLEMEVSHPSQVIVK